MCVIDSEYLFTCAISSESVSSTVYARRHLVAPLRDEVGVAAVLIDIDLGEMQTVEPYEGRQIGRMMNLLASANDEIIADSQHGRKVICIGKCQRLSVAVCF